MKKLTKKELKVLKEVLALFEKRTRNETGVRYSSGGFATAEMFNYDDDVIDIELKVGSPERLHEQCKHGAVEAET
jgi:hypothetical protein